MSVGDNLKTDWEKTTALKYKYNLEKKEDLLTSFKSLSKTRDDCYKYTCSCHGDGSDDSCKLYFDKNYEPTILKYGKYYCIITPKELARDHDSCCQTTAYFMQYLAWLPCAGNTIQTIGAASENVPLKYEKVKWNFIFYSGNMYDPHYVESYYILARSVK